MRVTQNFFWLGAVGFTILLFQTGFGVSVALGQAGIILPGLGENASNVDVTESGGSPTAILSYGCCDPMGMPINPEQGTAGEAVENLINDLVIFTGVPPNLTKWNDLQGDLFMIPVQFTLSQPRTIKYYTLTSANDSPERDPFEWRLLGSNVPNAVNPADFTLIEERTGVEFTNRHETQLFGEVPNTTAYSTYRFEFETQFVAQGANYPPELAVPNSIQLAEVELFENFAFAGPKITINRTTGAITLANRGNSTFNMTGYSLNSLQGALNSNTWSSITNNYDGNNGGTVDDDNWIRLTATNGRNDLSEVEDPNGNGASVIVGQTINLGNSWIKYPTEDITAEILLADGTTQTMALDFEGNGGVPFRFGDLNFSGGAGASITAADWNTFKQGQSFNFATVFSPPESYSHGDLDGDFDHDLADFGLFKAAFDAANGAGAFVAMLASIPEPSTAALLGGCGVLLGFVRPNRRWGKFLVLAGVSFAVMAGGVSQAGEILPGLVGNDLTNPDNVGPPDVTVSGTGAFPVNEGPPQAVDNDVNTKWLSFLPNGANYDLRFNNGGRSAVNAYTITSANDAEERDPYSWTLKGSNDGINFTTVDTQTAQDFTARMQTQRSTFTNTTRYNIYRFEFLTSQGAGVPTDPVPNSIQLAEIELFGTATVPVLLTLRVTPTTGKVEIVNNNAGEAIAFDAYRILSPAGSLNRNNWWGTGPTGGPNGGQSIHDQNLGAGFPVGTGGGTGWEEGPGSTNNQLAEWFLGTGGVGSSTLNGAQGITMNNIFQIGGAQDLTFEYRSAGLVTQGVVQYVGVGPVQGDYNGNGVVDAADYVVWRNGGPLQNDPTPGVQAADYTFWRSRFGATSGSGSGAGAAAVPEPVTWMLALIVPGLMLGARKRRSPRGVDQDPNTIESHTVLRRNAMVQVSPVQRAASVLVLTVACFSFVSMAMAVSTIDRNYRFGDDPQENAVVGQVVGVSSVLANHTLDSVTPFQDLMQVNSPTYANVQSTGRPGAAANEKGIQFVGANSHRLEGAGLGSPREGGAVIGAPYDSYANNRLMQIWARPTVDTGARQEVVSDTFQFGIFISATDTWGHTYGSDVGDATVGDDYATAAPVAYNQWTHIMQRTFDNDGVALYVNGVAVSRFNALYDEATGGAGNLSMYVGAASGGGTNFFTGQMDSLKLSVGGVFVPGPPALPIPVDWGDINLGAENDYIASLNLVPGDVNGDGLVNGTGAGPAATDDVRFFIDHWLNTRQVNNIVVGDLTSRTTMGDLNFDGRTSLADWSILRGAHAGGGSLDLAALLGGSVPEPSTAVLVGLAAAACGAIFRRRRRMCVGRL